MTNRGFALAAFLALPTVAVRAQGITRDSAQRSWTLRSGPVVYRLRTADARVVLDWFGPAAKEGDSTARVLPTYPRMAAPELAGTVAGRPLDTGSVRLVGERVERVAPGVDRLRLTLRHVTLPLEIEERFTAWGDSGVITRELVLANRGRASLAMDVTPTWLLPGGAYTLRYLYGSWGQERQLATEPLGAGARDFEQTHGRSSKGYVPWLSLRNERAGVEYLAELAWSGNWVMQVERTAGENDIELATRPVAVSHTGFKVTCDNTRNQNDDQLKAIARTGGVIGIGFWDTAVCGNDARAIARAIRYTASLVGVDHVALGSDNDGAVTVPFDISGVIEITDALLQEGFTDEEIGKIMGRNTLRLLIENLP